MKTVSTIGSAMRDMFLENTQAHTMHFNAGHTEQSFILLPEGRKIEVDHVAYHAGGGALNSARSFALAGHSVKTFCKLGTDAEGAFIKTLLQKHTINIDGIAYDATKHTGTSIIIPCPSGDRAIFVHRGANRTLTSQDIAHTSILSCDQLYATSLSYHAASVLPNLAHEAHKHGISVAVNPGTSQLTTNARSLLDALPAIDIFILNAHEARLFIGELTQSPTPTHQESVASPDIPELLRNNSEIEQPLCFSLRHFFTEITRRGPRIVVVTNGPEGVYATDGNHIYFHPSLKTKVISTVGAGDAFGSMFVSFLLEGAPVADALRAGIINAASVLTAVGAQTGLLTRDQIATQCAALDQSLLQQFVLEK